MLGFKRLLGLKIFQGLGSRVGGVGFWGSRVGGFRFRQGCIALVWGEEAKQTPLSAYVFFFPTASDWVAVQVRLSPRLPSSRVSY